MPARHLAFATTIVLLIAAPLRADDEDLRLLREPTGFTDAIDAFDENDAFDLNVHVGFSRSRFGASLQREVGGPGTSPRGSAELLTIGDYEHIRNVLDIGLDVGVYRDVMLYARLPLVLSDGRRILYPSSDVDPINQSLQTVNPGGDPVPLYYMPFESPTRSGLGELRLGLAFDILNQFRRAHYPTWLMLFEMKLGIGEIMTPCDPSEAGNGVVRDPLSGDPTLDASGSPQARECGDGVSTGTHAFRFESRISRRYRYAEVYSGLGYSFAWAGRAKGRYQGAPLDDPTGGAGDLSGFRNTRPPMQGMFAAGVTIIPWENRGRWQRFSIDLRGTATYVSEGRDYSPLYDALGSSQHRYLSQDNLEGVPTAGGPALRSVAFNGLTDVQAHGVVGAMAAIEMQAAQYLRFRFGAQLDYTTAHFLTFADACNPGVAAEGADDPRRGRCLEGIIDPHHRGAVDLPGQRFRLGGGLTIDLFVQATAQF